MYQFPILVPTYARVHLLLTKSSAQPPYHSTKSITVLLSTWPTSSQTQFQQSRAATVVRVLCITRWQKGERVGQLPPPTKLLQSSASLISHPYINHLDPSRIMHVHILGSSPQILSQRPHLAPLCPCQTDELLKLQRSLVAAHPLIIITCALSHFSHSSIYILPSP